LKGSRTSQIEDIADAYRSGRLSRRDFIVRAAVALGSVALAERYLSSTGLTATGVARAQEAAPPPPGVTEDGITIPANDPSIRAGMVEYGSLEPDGPMLSGYMARPARPGTYPSVVIIHENRGLIEHFKDLARRYAKEGFVALAPDLLSRDGGTDNVDPASVGMLLNQAGLARHASDAISAGHYMGGLPGVQRGAYGITGFCFGGGVTWLAAMQDQFIAAAVPYYGRNPQLDRIPGMRAAVLAIYGELDQGTTATMPEVRAAMEAAGIQHETIVYPNATHAFFIDTQPNAPRLLYNPEAAADAWPRTINWFRTYLPPATA
jgi:carboxymethylenebutenolidase